MQLHLVDSNPNLVNAWVEAFHPFPDVTVRRGVVGRDIYCPGLATGVGAVPPEIAAVEMARAYGDWKKLSNTAL